MYLYLLILHWFYNIECRLTFSGQKDFHNLFVFLFSRHCLHNKKKIQIYASQSRIYQEAIIDDSSMIRFFESRGSRSVVIVGRPSNIVSHVREARLIL